MDVFVSLSQIWDWESYGISDDGLAMQHEVFENPLLKPCIRSFKMIEANLPPTEDVYHRAHGGMFKNSQTKRSWLHGPNDHFIAAMKNILAHRNNYDAVLIMEADTVPVKKYWLDELIKEAEETPFMILGRCVIIGCRTMVIFFNLS